MNGNFLLNILRASFLKLDVLYSWTLAVKGLINARSALAVYSFFNRFFAKEKANVFYSTKNTTTNEYIQ